MAAVASIMSNAAPNPPQEARNLGFGLASQGSRAKGQTGHYPDFSRALSRAFTTALLLTANTERAEAAVLDGINALHPGEASPEKLFLEVAAAAFAAGRGSARRLQELECAASVLPPELRPVLRLPLNLRQCFVLRVLMSLSRESCARLLVRGVNAVDHDTRRAAQALARVAAE